MKKNSSVVIKHSNEGGWQDYSEGMLSYALVLKYPEYTGDVGHCLFTDDVTLATKLAVLGMKIQHSSSTNGRLRKLFNSEAINDN